MLGAGCAMQPSRSQTMSLEGNTINVYVSPRPPAFAVVDPTNAVPSDVAGGDTFCQAMMIATGDAWRNDMDADLVALRDEIDARPRDRRAGARVAFSPHLQAILPVFAGARGGSRTRTPLRGGGF
jgi:hypothetical protein